MDVLSRVAMVSLLNSLWQIALVAGAAMLADRWLRRAPARYRHVLWMVALAAVIALPVASTWRAAVSGVATNGTVRSTRITASAALPPAVGNPPNPPSPSPRIALLRGLFRAARAGTHLGIWVPRKLGRAILALYLGFLAVMLIRFARACSRTRQIRRFASAQPLSDDVAATLARCMVGKRDAGWRSGPIGVTVLWSSQLAGPVTLGARRPAIILPSRLNEPRGRADLQAALAHELAHVRRHDYLWNLVCELLALPVAFHPLTSMIRRRLRECRELACDELAANILNPADYARSLVRMAHEVSGIALPATLMSDYTLGVFDADILEERVMRLLKPRASMRLAKCSLFCAALIIAASCVAAASFGVSAAQNGPTVEDTQISANSSVSSAVAGGVVGGVVGGVPGGALGIVNGGVKGGLRGGTIGGVSNGGIGGASGVVTRPAGVGASKDSDAKTGSLAGIVVDSSGARIPRAEIRLVSRNNSFQQTAEADETGNFSFDGIPAGRYSLEVTSPGMGGAVRSFEFKAEGEPPFFPFILHPGDMTETAVVMAKGPADPSGASAAGPHKIRIGGAVAAAKLIEGTHVSPKYPQEAKDKGIEGPVVLEVTISVDGVPTDLKVVSSPDDSLSQAATDAVKQWRYQPTLLNGEPVSVVTTITVNFQLQN